MYQLELGSRGVLTALLMKELTGVLWKALSCVVRNGLTVRIVQVDWKKSFGLKFKHGAALVHYW